MVLLMLDCSPVLGWYGMELHHCSTTTVVLSVGMIRWLVYILLVTVHDQIKVYRIPHPVRALSKRARSNTVG